MSAEVIYLTVPVKLAYRDADVEHGASIKMFWKVADFMSDVTDEAGNDLGYVAGISGGGFTVRDLTRGESWYVGPEELWEAFQAAVKERYE